MDGSLGIRVDDPSEIVDASSASSPSDLKALGNKCFQAKEHQQALDFYKKALETCYACALFFFSTIGVAFLCGVSVFFRWYGVSHALDGSTKEAASKSRQELSILCSNRSLCQMKLGNHLLAVALSGEIHDTSWPWLVRPTPWSISESCRKLFARVVTTVVKYNLSPTRLKTLDCKKPSYFFSWKSEEKMFGLHICNYHAQ